jgi:hypothetical protein
VKQTKLMSFIEAAASIAIGFGISLGAQIVFLPMLGVPIDHAQNFKFALIMTAISLCRQFIMRRVFEALHIRRPLSAAMQAVIAERHRQFDGEGYGVAHDDAHGAGELARAGACYLVLAGTPDAAEPPRLWPWSAHYWNPKDMRRDLVRGLALGLAELERFDRLARRKPS